MKRWKLLIVIVVPFMFGQMCGTQEAAPPPECLELEDVIGIPAGTAAGTGFSGTYRALSAVVETCQECGSNTVPDTYCSAPQVEQMRLVVIQDMGVLTIDHTDIRMTGRIDADGSFEVGGVSAPTRDDGMKTGQALTILRGHFAGELMIADLQLRLTAQDANNDTLDLEQTAAITAEREPLQ